MENRLG